ncbi:MAG: ABC transporter permease [Paraperlucidibaca sp.]
MTMSPLTQRRLTQFKANRRAWWSLWLLLGVFALTLGAELIANDKPLLVSYRGELIVPMLEDQPETYYGGKFDTPTVYRDPAVAALIDTDGWMLWPLIRFNADTIHFERAEPTPSPPTAENWLGTDDQGRDVMARLIYGVRTSLAFASLLTLATVILGVAAGAAQGYFGGWVDLLGQRFTEIWSGLPVLFMLIILSSLVTPNFWWLLALLTLFSWTDLSGLVRAEFLRTRQLDYVRAARAMGVSSRVLVWRHVLPNAAVTTLTLLPFIFTGAIGLLTSLDFLGFGLPPGSASLGEMIAQGKNNLQAPWLGLTAFFSLSILLSLLVFIGEGLRDAFDPRHVEVAR